MALSPHPQGDGVLSRDGRANEPWWRWFHALRTLVNADSDRVTALEARLTALEARVTALEGP